MASAETSTYLLWVQVGVYVFEYDGEIKLICRLHWLSDLVKVQANIGQISETVFRLQNLGKEIYFKKKCLRQTLNNGQFGRNVFKDEH